MLLISRGFQVFLLLTAGLLLGAGFQWALRSDARGPSQKSFHRVIQDNAQSAADFEKTIGFEEVIAARMRAEPLACLNYLADEEALGNLPESHIRATIERLSQSDFVSTLRLIGELRSTRLQDLCFQIAFHTAAKLSPREALAQITVAPAYLRESIGRDLAQTWIAAEPEAALPALFANQRIANPWIMHALSLWAKDNPLPAFDLLARLSNEELRQQKSRFISSLLVSFAESNGDAASEILDKMSEEQRRMFAPFVYGRLFSSVEAARRELNRYPSGLIAQRSFLDGMQIAAFNNFERATQIADLLPGGVARQRAYMMLAQTKARLNVAATAEWANKQTDPFLSAAAIDGTAFQWLQMSPAAAVDYAFARLNEAQDQRWLDALAHCLFENPTVFQESVSGWASTLPPKAKAELKTRISSFGVPSPELEALFN